MRLGVLFFLAGLLVFHNQTDLPPRWLTTGLPLLLMAWVYLPRFRLPIACLAGYLWPLLWIAPIQQQLPADWEMVDIQAQGWIASLPKRFSRSVQFNLMVAELRRGGEILPFEGQLQLSWYEGAPSLHVGDRWQLTVRLRRPHGMRNPGAFDFERWLFINRIAARGYVRPRPQALLVSRAERYPVNRIRQKIAERFTELLGNHPYRGLLTALAVGDRQAISADQWQLLSSTGTAHLLAISGLHIGLVAGLIFFLARWIWAFSPWLALRWPAPKAAAVIAFFAAAGYALLAGLSLPTQRALIMLSIGLLALLRQRLTAPSRILAAALLAVLLYDPLAPLSGGFWLSFGAVAAIIYSLSGTPVWLSSAPGWLSLQFRILFALAPTTLFLFQSLTLIAPLANAVAIPWASLTVVPLTLLAVLAGALNETLQQLLLQLAGISLDWLWRFLSWLKHLDWLQIYAASPPLWTLLFALPGVLLLLAPCGLPGRWLGFPLLLPLLYHPQAIPLIGNTWFTLLDVGSGLSAVIRTTDHVLVYDTGPRLGSNSDGARVALIPFLRQQGIQRIDTLIVSHADSQHTGGVRSLREAFPINRIITSSLLAVPISGAERCHSGDNWQWNEVEFQILHPPEKPDHNGNDNSCVLLVTSAGQRLLLPGDLETNGLRTLLPSLAGQDRIDVLVAPNHGHRPLQETALLTLTQPKYILFATGYRNRYGYPKPETREQYSATGAVILDTADSGAITFRLTAGMLTTPERYRIASRRYWHTP